MKSYNNTVEQVVQLSDRVYNQKWLPMVAIVAILLPFFVAGAKKSMNLKGTYETIRRVGLFRMLPFTRYWNKLATGMTVGIEFLVPLVIVGALLYGKHSMLHKYAKLGIPLIVGFTLLISLIFHSPMKKTERMNFMKNMGLVGGLVLTYKWLQQTWS